MTTATLVTRLPLAVGGALGTATARVGLWALKRFARAPLTYCAIFSLGGLSVLAASNALYLQTSKHPAPMFGEQGVPRARTDGVGRPVVLAPVRQQPAETLTPLVIEETANLPDVQEGTTGPVGNEDVFQVQQKLQALKLFDGKADGYYGPRTARAIRAFELAHGMRPLGALSPEVVEAILRAPAGDFSSAPREPENEPQVQSRPAQLQNQLQGEAQGQDLAPIQVAQREALTGVQADAQDQFTAVAEEAEGAFDAVAEIIGGLRGTPETSLSAAPPLDVGNAQIVRASAPADGVEANVRRSATDPILVAQVQRGLASLGFLAGTIDGVASEGTAKAIRNFEVYHNYRVTGEVSPELIGMLKQAGASF